jgi:hypothetical protein
MTRLRTDIHRPSAINPSDYTFVAVIYHGTFSWELNEHERKVLNEHMEITHGKFSHHDHGGTCHVCGAFALNLCYFYHAPTNSYIVTGMDCAEKMEFSDPALFRKFKQGRDNARKNHAGKAKAKELIIDHGDIELYESIEDIFNGDFGGSVLMESPYRRDQRFDWMVCTVADMTRKLIRYGNLSENQWKFLNSLVEQIASWEEKKKEEEEKKELIPDAPEGKVTISGTILSAKVKEDFYGYHYKMLVESDEGWKVWSTVPKSLGTVNKGEKIQFNANLTRSENDRSFAFAKRPSKAKRIS